MVRAITKATAMNGTATRNTSSIAWVNAVSTQVLTGSGRAWMAVTSLTEAAAPPSWPGAEAGTTSSRWWASRMLRMAPNSAVPMAPPMVRKKATDAVAAPMLRRSTLFCTAVTTTCMVKPEPGAEDRT